MKVLAMLSALLINGAAMAIVVEKVQQNSTIIPACEFCAGGTLETTTIFTVSNYSCRKFPASAFSLKLSSEPVGISGDTQSVVEVVMADNLMDCRGPESKHTYEVATKELQEGQEYILENRSLLNPTK